MTIIVIDDSPATLALLTRLASGSEEVVAFTDALAARAHLAGHAAHAIVVDYSMPGMTGIELARAVRADPLHAVTPIVMVTSAYGPEIRAQANAAGVTYLLSKPFSPPILKGLLQKILDPAAPEDAFDPAAAVAPRG